MNEQNTRQLKSYKILLIGDDCVDVYSYGRVERISPEAPVPVFVHSHTYDFIPGMAANVCKNLKTLGCDVTYLHGKSSTKTRLIDTRSKQHIVRIDNDEWSDPVVIDTADINKYDAVVISDYNKGTVDYETIETIRREFSGPVFVDTKKTDLARFEGCIVKINSLESSLASSKCTGLVVTLGEYGVSYKDKIYPATKCDVVDVCGAGDTFLSALTVSYLDSRNMETAIQFAIRAAGVTVTHIGVYAPTYEEIK